MESLSARNLSEAVLARADEEFRLGRGELRGWTLAVDQAVTVTAVDGTLWLTLEGRREDWVLEAGQSWTADSRAGGRLLVQALSATSVLYRAGS